MGAYEDITSYLWNWMVYMTAVGSMTGCWNIGVWGLMFDNDDGKMIDTCLGIVGGSNVTFPYTYSA